MTPITKLSDRFTEADSGDEIVIMRRDNGAFFSLSGTAAACWRTIDGTRDRAALIAALACNYSIDSERIETEVDQFLAQLKTSGLVVDG